MRAAPAPRTHTPTVAWALAANGPSRDKMRMDRAKREDDWPELAKAINAEVDTLWKKGTLRLIKRQPGMKVTRTTMLCERKRGATGEVERYKGRLVVRGDK